MRLILFDIDGTLLNANGAGKAAMIFALEEVFGTSGPSQSYKLAGKTDNRIVMDLMTAAGFDSSEIKAQLPSVYALMAERGRETFASAGIAACPGVHSLLEALRANPWVKLGLLTGNNSLTAPLKLVAAGLDPDDFPIGAYGSEALDRNLLPAIAWERAGRLQRTVFDGDNTVIVGDTPADIICAGTSGAKSLAVATGRYSAEALANYHPNHLLDDLADTRAALECLLSGEAND